MDTDLDALVGLGRQHAQLVARVTGVIVRPRVDASNCIGVVQGWMELLAGLREDVAARAVLQRAIHRQPFLVARCARRSGVFHGARVRLVAGARRGHSGARDGWGRPRGHGLLHGGPSCSGRCGRLRAVRRGRRRAHCRARSGRRLLRHGRLLWAGGPGCRLNWSWCAVLSATGGEQQARHIQC